MNLKIKKLERNDWEDYKSIRLETLQTYPNVFLSNFDEEKSWPQSKWQDDLSDESCAIFGVYDDSKIVGLTAIFTWRGDKTRQTAILAMSYRNPDFKGCGIGKMFYDARIEWATQQSHLTKSKCPTVKGMKHPKRRTRKLGFNLLEKK